MTSRSKKILVALAVAFIAIVVALGVLISAGVYSYGAATRAGNEAATMQNLKTIAAVETQFFITHNRTYGTIDELVHEDLLSTKFAAVPLRVDGYALALKLTKPGGFTLSADPADRSSGLRHFYLDSASMQIHVNHDVPAGPNDPLQ